MGRRGAAAARTQAAIGNTPPVLRRIPTAEGTDDTEPRADLVTVASAHKGARLTLHLRRREERTAAGQEARARAGLACGGHEGPQLGGLGVCISYVLQICILCVLCVAALHFFQIESMSQHITKKCCVLFFQSYKIQYIISIFGYYIHNFARSNSDPCHSSEMGSGSTVMLPRPMICTAFWLRTAHSCR
jgi:hypothetical protein